MAIASIGDDQQHAGGNIVGALAGIVSSPLTGAQGDCALPGQESESVVGDGHKPS